VRRSLGPAPSLAGALRAPRDALSRTVNRAAARSRSRTAPWLIIPIPVPRARRPLARAVARAPTAVPARTALRAYQRLDNRLHDRRTNRVAKQAHRLSTGAAAAPSELPPAPQNRSIARIADLR